jgi:hypothetical protein
MGVAVGAATASAALSVQVLVMVLMPLASHRIHHQPQQQHQNLR